MRVDLPNRFTPRPYQRGYMGYFDKGGKRAMWVMHRRGGKDLTALHQTCKLAHKRKGAYWHIFPTAEQGKKAIWEGFTRDGERIMEQVFPSPIRKTPRAFAPNGEMVVELKCGSIWRLMGSDKMEVVGAGPVGVVFSEFALAKPKTWDLIRPMLRENDGWASFITTPRGNNHAKKLFDMAKKDPEWFCELLTLRDTGAYDAEKTIAEERAEGMPEELIRQEYLCDWTAANVGSIYGDLVEALEKRDGICEFEHPADQVFTHWDLGITDAAGVWFWHFGENRWPEVVDHYENHGKPLSHYLDVLEERGYSYAKHYLPHDGRARTFVTGTTVQEQFDEWCKQDKDKRGAVGIGPKLSVLDGIQAARWLLQKPIRIHTRCQEGLDALRAYSWGWDEDRKAFSRTPLHDWSSHSSDAFRGFAITVKALEKLTKRPEKTQPKPVGRVRVTLDQLLDENGLLDG